MVAEPSEVFGVLVFASGKQAEQVAVGQGAQFLRAVAVAVQAVVREDARPAQAVLPLQLVKTGKDKPKPRFRCFRVSSKLAFSWGSSIGIWGCGLGRRRLCWGCGCAKGFERVAL